MIPKLHIPETQRPIILVAMVCAIFFSVIALIQSQYVESQTREETQTELDSSASEVMEAVNYVDHWDVKKYRQAVLLPEHYSVLTRDGLLIDMEGFVPSVLTSPRLTVGLEAGKPKSISTSVGDTWRLLMEPVRGGMAVFGIFNPQDTPSADSELIASGAKFDGLTVQECSSPRSARVIGERVEYGVIDSVSGLRCQWGGVPLEVSSNLVDSLLRERSFQWKIAGKEYSALARPIVSLTERDTVGLVLVWTDITLQQKALQSQKEFNYLIAGLSIIVTVSLLSRLFVLHEIRKRKGEISLEEALKLGESQTIEFKETLEVNLRTGERDKDILKASLRTINALLNTTGGTLFTGISDNLELKGLERDLSLCQKHDKDGFELRLRDPLRHRFHPSPIGKVDIKFDSRDGKFFCIINVRPASKDEVVHLDGEVDIRDGNTTRILSGQDLTDWLKERFRK